MKNIITLLQTNYNKLQILQKNQKNVKYNCDNYISQLIYNINFMKIIDRFKKLIYFYREEQ